MVPGVASRVVWRRGTWAIQRPVFPVWLALQGGAMASGAPHGVHLLAKSNLPGVVWVGPPTLSCSTEVEQNKPEREHHDEPDEEATEDTAI